ncbi:Crp/Fnr family transcriptional regulator [Novosphingobium guangzhouense]|nr:Crp/Fnr family transcriptional regulator [Novosphingobium guangzhouense]
MADLTPIVGDNPCIRQSMIQFVLLTAYEEKIGMDNPLTRKLSSFTDFSEEDTRRLNDLCRNTDSYISGSDLIMEGDRPDSVFFLLEGWAYRYKFLPDGNRQIVAYLIPGDLCDIHIFILKQMDHSIGLLSDAKVAAIPKVDMLEILDSHPRIAQALLWATLVDEAVLREWIVNMGQRDAFSKLAHLFCEMCFRMRQVGLVHANQFDLPLTQEQLGDTVGLTKVHVNRVLQRMRRESLISLSGKTLVIHDIERLEKIGEFDSTYLHLERRPSLSSQSNY